MELLIRLVGSYAGPAQRSEQGWTSPKMEASDFVDKLIQSLAASPSKDASEALGRLHANRKLFYWRDVLAHAKDAQRVIRRDAGYRHLKIDQICWTLNGGAPANAGDLAALVRDLLCELAVKIRTGNTDDWRQYWNEKPRTLDTRTSAGMRCFQICGNASRTASTPSPKGSTPETSEPIYVFHAGIFKCPWKSKRTGIEIYGAH